MRSRRWINVALVCWLCEDRSADCFQPVVWICRKLLGSGSVRSSHQTVIDYTPYVSDFQTFNNFGSWQPVGASKKNSFYLPFLTQVFHPWRCETCRVIQQQFSRKYCDILGGGTNILWHLLHIFNTQHPRFMPLLSARSRTDLIMDLIPTA